MGALKNRLLCPFLMSRGERTKARKKKTKRMLFLRNRIKCGLMPMSLFFVYWVGVSSPLISVVFPLRVRSTFLWRQGRPSKEWQEIKWKGSYSVKSVQYPLFFSWFCSSNCWTSEHLMGTVKEVFLAGTFLVHWVWKEKKEKLSHSELTFKGIIRKKCTYIKFYIIPTISYK